MMESKVGVIHLQAEEHQELKANTRSSKRHGRDFTYKFKREHDYDKILILDF